MDHDAIFDFFKRLGHDLAKKVYSRRRADTIRFGRLQSQLFLGHMPTYGGGQAILRSPVLVEYFSEDVSIVLEKQNRHLVRHLAFRVLEGLQEEALYCDPGKQIPVNFLALVVFLRLKDFSGLERDAVVCVFMTKEGSVVVAHSVTENDTLKPYIFSHNFTEHRPESESDIEVTAGNLIYSHEDQRSFVEDRHSWESFFDSAVPVFYLDSLKKCPVYLRNFVLSKAEYRRIAKFLLDESKSQVLSELLQALTEAALSRDSLEYDRFYAADQRGAAAPTILSGEDHLNILAKTIRSGVYTANSDNWKTLLLVQFLMRPEAYGDEVGTSQKET